jgi:hypothetical protein
MRLETLALEMIINIKLKANNTTSKYEDNKTGIKRKVSLA